MAEWLRLRVFIAENGLNTRRIRVGSIFCPSKKSIGWAVGVKVTSRRYYGRRKPIFRGRMAEWLRPQSSIAENGQKFAPDKRGFDILSLKEVHRLGGWCHNHVPSLLWLA